MSRRKSGLIVGAVLLVSGFLVLGSPVAANHADEAGANCATNDLTVKNEGSDAGGALITFVLDCTGKAVVHEEVVATIGTVTLFKATVDKTVNGSLHDVDAIHLPPLPKIEQVCVTVRGRTVCVPPS